ncbi:cell division protein ZapD [Shewanella avicenniae]|uniref:Cell division protein ZapD n=1 Tax=Shewanella avicenniae TaxID=2814294 RepID=A0ABX7QSV3_9GAMM|nr:cell division protein ZapD [Shewanella avicenniae]QSX34005.1 cell division protein ZapD [Shewanella avicenniae]
MSELLFEQPLNEKVRNYLRLEHLAKQLDTHLEQDHQQRCFYPLFALCELTERCDFRSEILKDIDRQLSLESSDLAAFESPLIDQLLDYREQLLSAERPGIHLKQNRFISALRQRFNMPGTCCNFDLPQLHYWLSKPWHERQQDYEQWVNHFRCLLNPITLMLSSSRERCEYQPEVAPAGFFQRESTQALSLIRVKLHIDNGCYPTISGHRNRFAIHFVQFDQQKHSQQPIEFLLATCD